MPAKNISENERRAFQKKIWNHYRKQGRTLPWRPPVLKFRKDGNLDAYKVLVSEVMLQQTQVDRVIPKYAAFLKKFPNIRTLARSSLSEVLTLWQGLGYNRRAKALKLLAEVVMREHKGVLPKTKEALMALPGIGEYTAGALLVFAHNLPAVFIETNIRSVFIHSFFPKKKSVSDKDIFPLIATTLPLKNYREWYYALMDYGASLKKHHPNPNRKSAGYVRQSPFKNSERRIRGFIIKKLLGDPQTLAVLSKEMREPLKRVEKNAAALIAEGFIQKTGKWLSLT